MVALYAVAGSCQQREKTAGSAFRKLVLNTLRTISNKKAKTVTYFRGGEMLTAKRKNFTISATAPTSTIVATSDTPLVPVEEVAVDDELNIEIGE